MKETVNSGPEIQIRTVDTDGIHWSVKSALTQPEFILYTPLRSTWHNKENIPCISQKTGFLE